MKFDSEYGVKMAIQGFLAGIMKEIVHSLMNKWHERMVKCVYVHGNYIENQYL